MATGRRVPLLDLRPAQAIGLARLGFVTLADDPRIYAFVATRYSSELFTVDGVR